MLTVERIFDNIIFAFGKKNVKMERYRSGHNEAVLKTVCPQGRVGSNPTLSVRYEVSQNEYVKTSSVIWRSTQEAEGTPLERVQVVNSGARVQIPPSPFENNVFEKNLEN